jgi:hypothetical protein
MSDDGRRPADPRNRQGAILGPTTATKQIEEDRSMRTWHVTMGVVPALLLAVGVTMMLTGPSVFWWGFALSIAALGWLVIDWYIYSRKRFSLLIRMTGYAASCLCMIGIITFAFRPMPLDVSFHRMAEHYPAGTDIDGIKWRPEYAGFRAFLVNKTDFQYANLDFLIRVDVLISGVGVHTKSSQCTSEATLPGVLFGGFTLTDPKGMSVPLPPMEANIFRINCDRILPNSQLELIIATRADGGFSEAAAVKLSGSYEAYFRTRRLERQECLVNCCSPLP